MHHILKSTHVPTAIHSPQTAPITFKRFRDQGAKVTNTAWLLATLTSRYPIWTVVGFKVTIYNIISESVSPPTVSPGLTRISCVYSSNKIISRPRGHHPIHGHTPWIQVIEKVRPVIQLLPGWASFRCQPYRASSRLQYRQQVTKFCQDAAKTLGTNRQNGDNGNCDWPPTEITLRAIEHRTLLVEIHANEWAEETSPKMADITSTCGVNFSARLRHLHIWESRIHNAPWSKSGLSVLGHIHRGMSRSTFQDSDIANSRIKECSSSLSCHYRPANTNSDVNTGAWPGMTAVKGENVMAIIMKNEYISTVITKLYSLKTNFVTNLWSEVHYFEL